MSKYKPEPTPIWRQVVHACECNDDGMCPYCGIEFADCGCPGPMMDDVYEYRVIGGVMCARPIKAPKSKVRRKTPRAAGPRPRSAAR